MLIGFNKHEMNSLRVTRLQLLLQISTAMLIFAKRVDVTLIILDLGVRESSDI